jgi:ADP-heptose:LPS heptosyltransferase
MNIPLKYKTSSPAGDLISFLAGVKRMWEDTGRRAIIYQRIGMQGIGYEGSIHPFQNSEGETVCMSEYMFDMLKPLIEEQEYVESFLIWKGEDFDVDFDLIRLERYTNQPKGSLNRWFNYVFPQMASDLSKPWIELPKTLNFAFPWHDKIIINFTQRYRNYLITYHFLKKHQNDIIFVGLPKEKDIFCKTWDLEIQHYQPDNFYQLAQAIKNCKFFLGNQSFCFQLAEALKTPRILETFTMMPNVIPIGEKAFDFYHQGGLEYYFEKLIK